MVAEADREASRRMKRAAGDRDRPTARRRYTRAMAPSELEHLALEAALEQARKSQREGGIPIGSALLTEQGVVVALGHNRRVQDGDPTAHAETVCIRSAGRRRDWHTLILASTLSPCAMCTGTSILHKIPRVIIGENRNFRGREDWFAAEGVRVSVLDDERCRTMMAEFIRQHPSLWDEDIAVVR